jgi:hypothetical protein|nr:MAG TPA: hypothetical protein [Caudoviricetes sp.]
MAKEKILDGITRAYIYNANYRALQEMGAGTKLLKAFEEYKEAPLRELKAAAEYVAAWQQAKIAELQKDAYIEARRQQEKIKEENEKKENFGIETNTDLKKFTN